MQGSIVSLSSVPSNCGKSTHEHVPFVGLSRTAEQQATKLALQSAESNNRVYLNASSTLNSPRSAQSLRCNFLNNQLSAAEIDADALVEQLALNSRARQTAAAPGRIPCPAQQSWDNVIVVPVSAPCT